ncbi:hypothetical protein GWK47_032368 [Chionoecetes opilio]|uniref:Uncharacterized protein n=1 Tax=Chionoecetes opilio TaxID=41210 RepID=A0A8J4YUF8_CHIOP|nr:hypothetical protein GWK47_032368 [Chionoecetes opilio]
MEIVLPTAIHPLLLPVIRFLNPEKVDAVISRLLFDVTEQAVLDTSEGSSPDEDEEDDFFKALKSPGHTATEGTNSTCLSNKMGKELESWCSEKQRNNQLEQAMFPALFRAAWVDVFVKYNTAIPSSAAVERLLLRGDIMKANRASLTSDNFERLSFIQGTWTCSIWNSYQRTLNEESEDQDQDLSLRDQDQDQTFRDQDQPSETKTKTLRDQDQDQDQTLQNRPRPRTGI